MRSSRIGIDFGTTNTSIARAEGGQVTLAHFAAQAGETPSYRSLLYLEQAREKNRPVVHSYTGPAGIERYLAADHDSVGTQGRLIQSLKSYLPSKTLTGTEVFGRRYTLEDLIARILTDVRVAAEKQFGHEIRSVTAGRPVRFVGSDSEEDDAYAESRLRQAFQIAGYEDIRFQLEPIGAAYSYEASLERDELILIGDFGGGTSDFSLLHVGPSFRNQEDRGKSMLGTSGLGLAGDAFDAKIVRKLVSPALGAETLARSLNKLLPAVPNWIYANLERWHYLSFLRTRNVMEILGRAEKSALEPEKITSLITLIERDLGYQLHQAVQRTKVQLSLTEAAEFYFRDDDLELRAMVTRAEFEGWIADELQAIERTVQKLLDETGVQPHQIDRVFLTGGTSFVPAVRTIFHRMIGEGKLRTGNEFTSVAYGLSLSA
ncbi:Hsp70 family protein [Terriglobus tenax]|uniref:Hsp70 family protein n=1 Tax=Terriglobus tenax TaxID=1111115 RepID=UPI0021DF8D2E|nr:Hsp70 family protein [Terriglobus tenax]